MSNVHAISYLFTNDYFYNFLPGSRFLKCALGAKPKAIQKFTILVYPLFYKLLDNL